jgi:hypothetical protein
MPRFPKRLLALGGLAAGGAAFKRARRGKHADTPAPAPAPTATAPPVTPAPATPAPAPGPKPVVHTDDAFVAAEEAAAAAAAGGIGGPRLDDAHGDEAFEAVAEAGGGESEGFELAEEQLIDNATHGGGRADPIGDAFTPEAEADERTGVDGEADGERVSQRDEDDAGSQ